MINNFLFLVLASYITFLSPAYGMKRARSTEGALEAQVKRRKLVEDETFQSLEEQFKQAIQEQEKEHASLHAKECKKKISNRARNGDKNASFMLARIFDKGEGVQQDYLKAIRWYALALEQGEQKASQELVCLFDLLLSFANSYTQLEQSFKDFNARALRLSQNSTGSNIARINAPFGMFLQFQQLNYADTAFDLGILCKNGWGTAQDEEKAETWFKKSVGNSYIKAAHQGNSHALSLLRELKILDKTDYFCMVPADIIYVIINLLKTPHKQAWHFRGIAKKYCSIFDSSVVIFSSEMLKIQNGNLDKFVEFLSNFQSLTTLDLSCTTWSTAYEYNKDNFPKICTSLTSINLSNIVINETEMRSEPEGGFYLAMMLSSNKNLRMLNLSINNIKFSTPSITDILRTNCNLTELDLSNNRIMDAQLASIAGLLRANSSLTKLDLSANLGTWEYYETDTLISLTTNNNLKELDLSQNIFDGEEFIDSLLSNTTLIKLYIYNCAHDLYQEGELDAIARLWNTNTTLKELVICLYYGCKDHMHKVMKSLISTDYAYNGDDMDSDWDSDAEGNGDGGVIIKRRSSNEL